MMIHELKTWPEFYEAALIGDKTFEVRKNDRGFQKGDVLRLREYDPKTGMSGRYTGRINDVEVTYVLNGWGIEPQYVVMGIKPMEAK